MTEEVLPDNKEELVALGQAEFRQWQLNGLPHPYSLPTNGFLLDKKLLAVVDILIEKLGITKEEMDIAFAQAQIRELRRLRSELVQQRIMQGVHEPPNGDTPPGIQMPWQKD